ncbi:MAG: hypothetical protein OXH09_22695 [Gammaproteobacteria bacterium]|nr:hypothetical protein [Gammaproteobacteria bacterium]
MPSDRLAARASFPIALQLTCREQPKTEVTPVAHRDGAVYRHRKRDFEQRARRVWLLLAPSGAEAMEVECVTRRAPDLDVR